MAEDTEAAREELIFVSITLYVLDFQELDDGLRHRQSSRHGSSTLVATIWSSGAWARASCPRCHQNWRAGRPAPGLRRPREYCNSRQSATRFPQKHQIA